MIFDLLKDQFNDIEENTTIIEVLLEITLKKAFDEWFKEFNHNDIDGTIKKEYKFHNTITKKETQILVDYYKGRPMDS